MNNAMSQTNSTSEFEDVSNWIKPNDVMKSRKVKSKRYALNARLNASSSIQSKSKIQSTVKNQSKQKKNPFRCLLSKNDLDGESNLLENSSDESLFKLFKKSHQTSPQSLPRYDFSNLFSNEPSHITKDMKNEVTEQWINLLYVDWSLKSRIRFHSPKPFHWKHTFKTSEEASGTTGFVRCLNHGTPETTDSRTLDTSTNAQFYQCCLLWQHPNLPLVKLFPRDKQKASSQTGMFGLDQEVVRALHSEWGESLRSLYQLLRVRQCPYFYVCGHSFTCLFRAAGAAGFPHTHALITPTARGFRQAMKREGVEFSMPLNNKICSEDDEMNEEMKEETEEVFGDTEEAEEPTEILENLGLKTSQFPSLNQNRINTESKKFLNIDGLPQSLVYVEDMELHGLVNFLLNCASCVSTTGPMAGVPPTLISPVAFHGGTLKSLKISGGSFRTPKGETNFSIDIQGPIVPTTVLNLCSLLSSSHDTYSTSLYPLTSTLPFCSISPSLIGPSMPMAFANEGLIDCGLREEIRKLLCQSYDDFKQLSLPESYREIQYKDGQFTWSDKL